MDRHDLNIFLAVLTFLAMLLPLGLGWLAVFLRLKNDISSLLHYCVLTLFSLIAAESYFLLAGFISVRLLNGQFALYIGAVSYYAIVYLTWPLLVLLTLISQAENVFEVIST